MVVLVILVVIESLKDNTVYYDETKAFEIKTPATKYLDLTITYRINKSGHSSVWALQVKNVLGSKNYEGYTYYYKTGTIENNGYTVILPILSYKIEF
jgi:outer membrane receptor protein involved in Fe transport